MACSSWLYIWRSSDIQHACSALAYCFVANWVLLYVARGQVSMQQVLMQGPVTNQPVAIDGLRGVSTVVLKVMLLVTAADAQCWSQDVVCCMQCLPGCARGHHAV
jgi:hypothetical protein